MDLKNSHHQVTVNIVQTMLKKRVTAVTCDTTCAYAAQTTTQISWVKKFLLKHHSSHVKSFHTLTKMDERQHLKVYLIQKLYN
jgi:hypothetical protein